MKKILQIIKNNKIKVIIAVIILGGITFFVTRPPKPVKREMVTVAMGTVKQEIDVTGRIEPAKQVELGVQSGGKVSSIGVKIGDKVKSGATLLRVNTADLSVRLAREQAALLKAKLVLSKAEPKTNASDDLAKAYEDGFNAVADTFIDLPSVVTGLNDMLNHSYLAYNTVSRYGKTAINFRNDAEAQSYTAEKAYDEVLKKYKAASRQSDTKTIEALIEDTYNATKIIADAVKTTNNLVDYIENQTDEENRSSELAADQGDLDDFTEETSGHLSALLDIKDTIKDSNTGITDEGYDIESIKIDIRQAELDIEDTQVEIGKRIIRAPIDGVITDIRTEVGENISSGTPVISLISSNQFQIEANLPESDVAKVEIGAEADVTLDAYGSDVIFHAKVVAVDPGETVIDGVATYKTTLQFIETDPRIKSGMTADILIKGEQKEGVLSVPQRAIIVRDGKKYVQVLEGEKVQEKLIQTGLRGSDGSVEVTDGLQAGEQVIVYSEAK
jgi:HlyD family secretion protein